MTKVKICGLRDPENLDVAIESGADFIGFVFYPPSPRSITAETAATLADKIPARVKIAGLFVDPSDELIANTLKETRLDVLQLHGSESAERVNAIKTKFSLPVMKAIAVGSAGDLGAIPRYESVADWLLFDAKPVNATLPGGTGESFDWGLLAGRKFQKPWMLSGGLTTTNIAAALRILKPDAVDVSSGVERARGIKDAAKIREFIAAAKN